LKKIQDYQFKATDKDHQFKAADKTVASIMRGGARKPSSFVPEGIISETFTNLSHLDHVW